MSFLQLILWIVVIAVVVYLVQRATFIDPEFKAIIKWIGIAAAIFVILVAFGVLGALDFKLPTIRG